MNKELRPLLVTMPIQIKGYDIDVMGIVSNIVYIRWVEDLRMKFLDLYWPFEEMLKKDQSPILAETHVQYKIPLTIYDRPVGQLWISDLGKAKWAVSFEIASEKGIHCKGQQNGYFFDLKKKRPVPLPDELKEQYRRETGNRN